MRIIEPKRTPHPRRSRKTRLRRRVLVACGIFLVTSMTLVVGLQYGFGGDGDNPDSVDGNRSINADSDIERSVPPQLLSGDQFQQFYESLVFPNTQKLETSPDITGNAPADARILQIAESRGYTLRSVPVLPIVKTNERSAGDDDLLQPKAYAAWQKLKAVAKQNGHELILTSGYRSIERQRELFLARLGPARNQPERIANGSLDSVIVAVLRFAAPPGFSRHHTGYTIDLRCGGDSRAFEFTNCFKWLNENNYQNAKDNGWIPSYPDGVDNQGPEPEPWEYVWVDQRSID